MTQFLPPNLLALFAAREPIPYLPPVDKLPYEKKTTGYTGIAAYVNNFEDPEDTPPPIKLETREQRQERKRRAKAELAAYKLEQDIALWNPTSNSNTNVTNDPYKTLFVARVNYDTSESKLRREFEIYGNIKKLAITHDKNSKKPRGYAFIEYEREKDMHSAYKHADGRKIDGKRVLVDVERGRIVKGWFPRRLGGGLGGTRRGGPEVNVKHSGREEPGNDDHHYRGRDRDRPERPERRRSRSRSRERRRKSRSRSRDRHRSDRHKRDRSRDRERVRDHDGASLDKADGMDGANEAGPDGDVPRKERRRSRSRDRGERRRRRSRSRDRKRRDHDKDRDSRRSDRDRDRDRGGDRDERIKMMPPPVKEEQHSPDGMQENFDSTSYEGEYNNNYNNNNNMEANNYEGY